LLLLRATARVGGEVVLLLTSSTDSTAGAQLDVPVAALNDSSAPPHYRKSFSYRCLALQSAWPTKK